MVAAEMRRPDICKILSAHGADMDAVDLESCAALFACYILFEDILLDLKISTKAQGLPHQLHARGSTVYNTQEA